MYAIVLTLEKLQLIRNWMLQRLILKILMFSSLFYFKFDLLINDSMGELKVEKHVKYILSIEKVCHILIIGCFKFCFFSSLFIEHKFVINIPLGEA